jgi:hypothetical protein
MENKFRELAKKNLIGAEEYFTLYEQTKEESLLYFAHEELEHFVYFAKKTDGIGKEETDKYGELYLKFCKEYDKGGY